MSYRSSEKRTCNRILVALALLGVGVGVEGVAQVLDAPIREFTLPLMDQETLELKARIRGDIAQPVERGDWDVQGVRFETFGPEGVTNLVVFTDRCRVLVEARRVESGETLRVESGDGQLGLRGRGFAWDEAGGLVISNQVAAALQRPKEEGADSRVADRPLNIDAGRFTYHEGRAAFRSGVQVMDGEDRLGCERLLLQLRMEPGKVAPEAQAGELSEQVESITAQGAVEVVSSNLVARADQAVYHLSTEIVELSGQARWRSGDREGEAATIRLNRKEDRLDARGDVRVRLIVGSGNWMPSLQSALAKGKPPSERIEVRSDRLEVAPVADSPGLSRATFSEEVEVVRESGRLICQALEVRYVRVAGAGTSPEVGPVPGESVAEAERSGLYWVAITADGGVQVVEGESQVTGRQAVYTAESGVVDLSGPVTWVVEGKEGRADQLRLYPLEGMTELQGSVKMHLPAGSLGSVSRVLSAGAPSVAGSRRTGVGAAETTSAAQPVEVDCDLFRYREAGRGSEFGQARFLGGVSVTSEPDLHLTCQQMLAEIRPQTNTLHRLVATGAVEVEAQDERGTRVARGERAEYLAADDRLWLTGADGVEMVFTDQEGTHRARGRLAVYEGRNDVLELRSEAILESVHGRLWGDVVRVDRLDHVLAAGGMWRARFPAGVATNTVTAFDLLEQE